jgi:hypothetical protein
MFSSRTLFYRTFSPTSLKSSDYFENEKYKITQLMLTENGVNN